MKIAMVFDGLGIGGTERVGIDYIKIMQGQGYEVDVYNLNPQNNVMEKQLPDNCKLIRHNFDNKLCPELYSYGIKKWWWGKFAYPIIYVFLLAVLYIRRIFEKQRTEEYEIAIAFSGHFNDLTYVAHNFISAKKKMCWLHGALYGYLLIADGYVSLYQRIKNIVVLVEQCQDEVLDYNKYLKLNIFKLYNPTYLGNRMPDLDKVNELKNKYNDFVLMVARFDSPKDHITLINSIKLLREYYGLSDINCVLLGDGPRYDEVKSYCTINKLDGFIFMPGSCSDVESYYRACSIVVLSSLREGLPTVILEGLAMEKPVVATDCMVGPKEILGNNEFGLLCKVKDERDMAEKISILLKDQITYKYYIEQGKKRILDFSPESVSIELERVFGNLS